MIGFPKTEFQPKKPTRVKRRIPVTVREAPYGATTNKDHNLLIAQKPFVVCS